MSLGFLYVVTEDGALVDTVEYESGAPSKAVADVAAALGMDEAAAAKLVAKNNPGAELSSEDAARALAEQIAAKNVPDRDPETYLDPDGNDVPLRVTDQRPAPAAPQIVKTEA